MSRQLTRETLKHGVAELCDIDADLARVVERFGPPPLFARRPGFVTLVRLVLEQQVSLASGDAMYRRLKAAVDPVTPEAVRKLEAAGLRELGFTRQKARYCRDIADRTVSGELDFGQIAAADDAGARRLLLAERGIGPWSAVAARILWHFYLSAPRTS